MNIPSAVQTLLKSAAPTLLASLALPPPLSLIASAVASSALERFVPKKTSTPAPKPGEAIVPKAMTPSEVVSTVESNATDPKLILALQQAENDLKKYEMETGLRFAELEVKDRERAGSFQLQSGLSARIFDSGIAIVWIAVAGMLAMIGGLLAMAFGEVEVDPAKSQLTIAAFGLIGTAVGFVNGIAGTVVAFYWGSSQGSKEKTDAMNASIRDLSSDLGKAVLQPPPPTAPTPTEPVPPTGPTPDSEGPDTAGVRPTAAATPAKTGLLAEILPQLVKPHRHFKNGAEWALTSKGIAIDGADATGSPGGPTTVSDIWTRYGDLCAGWAKRYGVPVELIVATIATESSGKPDARRPESNGRESVGLMQTLVGTAREALGRPKIVADDLLDPSLSIEAGTAYIAAKRNSTLFDPVLVAAAYNAGSLQLDDAGPNRWKLRCFPLGTGNHIDKFIAWFSDAMRVSAEQNWGADGAVPSFASAIAGNTIVPFASMAVTEPAAAASVRPIKLLTQFNASIALTALPGRADLAIEVQQRLSQLGYLDPPPDGDFGPVSVWALAAFCRHNGIPAGGEFTKQMAETLIAPVKPLADVPRTNGWMDRVIDYMSRSGHWICRYPGCMNIVYLEGVDPDGTPNEDAANVFNDVRMVFWLEPEGKLNLQTWRATTEPGTYWVLNPMDPGGAARIKFDQYKSWVVGTHLLGKPSAHEALVQRAPVSVHRDLNKDHKRSNDKIDTGVFGINQHWGYDAATDNVGKTSAGCLVGQTREGHIEFMTLLKKDPRFLANNGYRFMTAILPADEVLKAPGT